MKYCSQHDCPVHHGITCTKGNGRHHPWMSIEGIGEIAKALTPGLFRRISILMPRELLAATIECRFQYTIYIDRTTAVLSLRQSYEES
jgi:hypothetical protein